MNSSKSSRSKSSRSKSSRSKSSNSKNRSKSQSKSKKYLTNSKYYDENGDIVQLYEFKYDNDFFRKFTRRKVELDISEKIMNNPNPNVVTIYNVNRNDSIIDMELLDTEYELNNENKEKIDKMIKNVIVYLHSLHIMYIDWKYDNIGMDKDGNFKLFDFDSSGIANDSNTKWIKSPASSYALALLSLNHITEPLCSDNFLCFLFINGMLDGNDHENIYENDPVLL